MQRHRQQKIHAQNLDLAQPPNAGVGDDLAVVRRGMAGEEKTRTSGWSHNSSAYGFWRCSKWRELFPDQCCRDDQQQRWRQQHGSRYRQIDRSYCLRLMLIATPWKTQTILVVLSARWHLSPGFAASTRLDKLETITPTSTIGLGQDE
jgi:hypothetical protein